MISAAARERRREKRSQKQMEWQVAMLNLRSKGLSCSNCKHFAKAPFSVGKGHICEMSSDSGGYVMAVPDGLCTDHAPTVTRHDGKAGG